MDSTVPYRHLRRARNGLFLPWRPAIILLLALPCAAGIIPIQNGSTQIGTLDASVGPTGFEYATFTLLPEFRSLMSDASGFQFRYFQTIYYDDEPVTYHGAILTPAGAPEHSGTVVDPPAGGWDYQQPGGDDLSPFFESNTQINPATGQYYYYPTKSYPNWHAADGVDPGTSTTADWPGIGSASHKTLFETYLVFVDPLLTATRQFDLLGGYAWGVGRDSFGQSYGIAPAEITYTDLTAGKVSELQGALYRSGFTGADTWLVQAPGSFTPQTVPEPSPVILLVSGALAIVVCRSLERRRKS